MNQKKDIVVLTNGPMGLAISHLMKNNVEKLYIWVPDSVTKRKWEKSSSIKFMDFELNFPKNCEVITGYDFFKNKSLILVFAVPSRQFEEITELIFASLNNNFDFDFVLITKGILNASYRRKYNIIFFYELIQEFQKKYNIEGKLSLIGGSFLIYDILKENYVKIHIVSNSEMYFEFLKSIFRKNNISFYFHSNFLLFEIVEIFKNLVAIILGMVSEIPGISHTYQAEIAGESLKEMMEFAKTFGYGEKDFIEYNLISNFLSVAFNPQSRNRNYGRLYTQRFLKDGNESSLWDKIQLFINPSGFIEKEILSHQNLADGGLSVAPLIEILKEKNLKLPLIQNLYEIFLRKNTPLNFIQIISDSKQDIHTRIRIPTIRKKGRIELVASGKMITNLLVERVLKKITNVAGLQLRIKRQADHILSSLNKRLDKAIKQRLKKDKQNFQKEIELWKELKNCKLEEEKFYLEKLIRFYADNIVDYYIPVARGLLIRFLAPFRFILGGFQKGTVGPFIGGHLEEVKKIINEYPVFYVPTHKTHLDSVELAYGLFFKGFPIPRVAAASVLMSNPLWGAFLRSLGAYVVDRENTKNILYLEVLTQYNLLMLESGIPAMAYPEGTRSRNGAFQTIKTGLLSTAVTAFQESGREIAIIPIAISHQQIPEDYLFTNQEKKVSFWSYVFRRKRVYFDFGKPIFVSEFIHKSDPLVEITNIILKEWKYHFRVQPHFVIARILYQHLGKDRKEIMMNEIQEFVNQYKGQMVTRDVHRIYEKGTKILISRKIIKKTSTGFEILNPSLLEYYGNMIPEITPDDEEYIQYHE